jgi:hypothetical protein
LRAVLVRCAIFFTDHEDMTMNTTAAPAGWHPDPSNPAGALRWWDGSAWTTHTHPVAPNAAQAVATPAPALPTQPQAIAAAPAWAGGATITPNSGTASYGTTSYGNASYGGNTYAPANVSFAQRNRHSLTAIGVVALYVLLAMTTHFVLIGIVPVMLSVRAIKAKETMAPAAVAAAVVAVLVALVALQ